MLEWRLGGVRYRLSLLFPALVTALLLWQPDGLAVSCLLASLIHEGGHLLAMMAVGVPPQRCTVGAFGLRIDLDNTLVGYGKNMLISLAGPLANGVAAALLLCADRPNAAMVHLVLAGLNLLPASALDGGELLRCGVCLLGMETLADAVVRFTSALVLLPLATSSLWLCIRNQNPTLLIVSVYLTALVFFSEKSEKNT